MSDYFENNIYISNCVFKNSKLSFKHLVVVPKKHGMSQNDVGKKVVRVTMILVTLTTTAVTKPFLWIKSWPEHSFYVFGRQQISDLNLWLSLSLKLRKPLSKIFLYLNIMVNLPLGWGKHQKINASVKKIIMTVFLICVFTLCKELFFCYLILIKAQ